MKTTYTEQLSGSTAAAVRRALSMGLTRSRFDATWLAIPAAAAIETTPKNATCHLPAARGGPS